MHIKLVLPNVACSARLSFFKEKQYWFTSTRDRFKDTLLRIERDKSPGPGGNRTTSSLLRGIHPTAVQQLLIDKTEVYNLVSGVAILLIGTFDVS